MSMSEGVAIHVEKAPVDNPTIGGGRTSGDGALDTTVPD